MRLQLLSGSLLAVPLFLNGVQAAPSASSKLAKLENLSASASDKVIRLNSALYDEFTAPPREGYSISIVLTALKPQFNCAQCREFDGEHSAAAKQWSRSARTKGDEKHFFASLDFPDGQEVFRRLGLSTAPVLKLFHPTTTGSSKPKNDVDQYEFRQGLGARPFTDWLVNTLQADISFTYRTPIDYSKLLTYVLFSLAAVITVYKQWSFFRPIITGRILWSIFAIGFILLMTSGYMWNQIRHPPYMVGGQNGVVNFIAGGYSNQYGVETHIISAVYAALAFSVVTIIVALPKIRSEKGQRVGVYLWVGVLIVMHAVLTGLFAIKSPGYPYKLFL